jgi:hypothetical protein
MSMSLVSSDVLNIVQLVANVCVLASLVVVVLDSRSKDKRTDKALEMQKQSLEKQRLGLENQSMALEAQITGLKKQVTSLETQALRDFNDELFNIDKWLVDHPKCFKIISKKDMSDIEAEERAFAFYIMNVFCHAHDLNEKKIMVGADWDCNFRWMQMVFNNGQLKHYWLSDEEFQASYDPDFVKFINKFLVGQKDEPKQVETVDMAR